MFGVFATGVRQAAEDDPRAGGPPLRGTGSGGSGGGGGGGSQHRTTVELDWTLVAPDGTQLRGSQIGAHVTADVLARQRNAAGFSSRAWTLRLTVRANSPVITDIDCSASITPDVAVSDSAPPILDAAVVLEPGQARTFELDVNRVGDLTIAVTSTPGAAIALAVSDAAGRSIATGTNQITHAIGLRDLHLAGPGLWRVTLTAPATLPAASINCALHVQVFDTLRIPAGVLQPRLDAVLQKTPEINAFSIAVDYDAASDKNFVYVNIDEDLFFTLDNFGFLDNIENARFAMDRDANPDARRVPLDPGQDYRFASFPGNTISVHNLRTGRIRAQVDPDDPQITLSASLLIDPDRIPAITYRVDIPGHPEVGVPVKHAEFTVDFRISASPTTGLALAVTVHPVRYPQDLDFNLDGLDNAVIAWLTSSNPGALVHDALQGALTKLLSGPVLQPIFTTLMGGPFTFLGSTARNGAWEFRFIPGFEERPHQVSPFYSARGQVAPGTAPSFTSPNLDKIDHIVVLLMENRSFDHMLGYLSLGARSDVDGLTPALISSFGEEIRPAPLTETRLPFDPEHSFEHVAIQMGTDLGGQGPMRGFTLSFIEKYPFMVFAPGSPQRVAQDDPYWLAARARYNSGAVMGYHTAKTVPVYDYLAREYMICDRWYASHPGPTFPNRFYYLGGHLNTDRFGEPQRDNDSDSLRLLRSRTIQDALTERGIAWKMYESPPDVCMLRMYARYAFDDTNIRPMDEFLAAARAGTLPSVSFLEPNYHIGKATNDDHPPSDIANGQRLIGQIYDALTANQAAWNKTLFIISYDEHGGLHDHHLPDLADRYQKPGEPTIDLGYGVRVPGFVISPWVPGGVTTRKLTPAVFDHTSILKTIVNRFCPGDPAIMSDRMAFANDLFPLLSLAAPRTVPPRDRITDIGGLQIGDVGVTQVHVGATPAASPARPVSSSVTAVPVVPTDPRPATPLLARRAMIAEAREQNAPLVRQRVLFQTKVDWHQYMTRLALMLR